MPTLIRVSSEGIHCMIELILNWGLTKSATPDVSKLLAALKDCKDLERGKGFHKQALKGGLLANAYVFNSLISMYSNCGCMGEAMKLFATAPAHDVVAWTCLIQGYVYNGQAELALRLFDDMAASSSVPNARTYVAALAACSSLAKKGKSSCKWLIDKVKDLHSLAMASHCCNVFVESLVIDVYAKCGTMSLARLVFDGMEGRRNVVTWTALLQGYVDNVECESALRLFELMLTECSPNARTYVVVLGACTVLAQDQIRSVRWLGRGKRIHYRAEVDGYCCESVHVGTVLVDMYCKCGRIANAQLVFDNMRQLNVVTWTALLQGYADGGECEIALELFEGMEEAGFVPNARTYVAVLTACTKLARKRQAEICLSWGNAIYRRVVRGECCCDIFVETALVNMYSSCGRVTQAVAVFDCMAELNVVTWNCIIQGFAENGPKPLAFQAISEMRESGVKPNSATLVAALMACGNSLQKGKSVHEEIVSSEYAQDVVVVNCLMDLYGKCGCMTSAQQVFDNLRQKNVVSWNTLMNGYNQQGETSQVMELFQKMKGQGVSPDKFTFTHLLTACSQAGLTNAGKEYFEAMNSEYGIAPDVVHYTCLVDLLGRMNCLDEATKVLKQMPDVRDASLWRMLLGACKKWKNAEIGKLAFENLLRLNEADAMAYTLMATIIKPD